MLTKIRDFCDTSVAMVILMDDIEQLSVMTQVLVEHVGINRCSYELYKDDITAYMIELRLPYNRYLVLMKNLRKLGWTLKMESKVDIFNRMIRLES